MSWFWNAFGSSTPASSNEGTKRNSRPSLRTSFRTSIKIQQFEKGTRRTGSLVLTKEDLKAINLQSKIDQTRRKIEHAHLDQEDELQVLRNNKENLLLQLDQKLEQLEDVVVYQEVIQTLFLNEGLAMADPGDGTKEAEIARETHKSELKDKIRTLFQQQASDELMEIYRTTPKFKERMSEREAKMLSIVFQKDALLSERKELNEKILEIQKAMIATLEKASQQQFEKRYEAIRDGNAANGDLLTRGQKLGQTEGRSYSSRILAAAAERNEEKQSLGGSLKDVILEEDEPNESHIGEVKKKPTLDNGEVKEEPPTSSNSDTASTRSAVRPGARSRSPVPTAPGTRSRSPVPTTTARRALSPHRGATTTGTRTAATTTRVRPQPTPSSRTGADRSPVRQATTTTSWERNRSPTSGSAATRRPVTASSTTRTTTSTTAETRRTATRPATRPVASRSPTRPTTSTNRPTAPEK